MFAASYFAPRYFTGSYWTKLGLQVEVPVEPPMAIGGPPRPPREIPFEQINVLVRGKLLVVRYSLVPGEATAGAKVLGDSILAVNAVADGSSFGLQSWQLIEGLASSRIILTDEEEFILMLAEAA